jgi:hypothetical protein
MNENELAEQTERLAQAEESFVSVARVIVEASNALFDILRSFRNYLESYHNAFQTTEDLMAQQIKTLKDLSVGMEALVRASAESNITLHENSERMTALLAKVESYFGTTSGLDYDN